MKNPLPSPRIAEMLGCDNVCIVNPHTLEPGWIPSGLQYDTFDIN
ncbi:MAG: hypothetical protein WC605_01590 [Bacteroidales bacterium]